MGKMIAAAVQFNPVRGEIARNRERIAALFREAAVGGARLVVFPEMATSGYVWRDREEIAPYVEPIPGPTTDALAALAAETGAHAVIGLPEADADTGAYYNSAVLIGPGGVVGTYRKTHLFAADPRWAREGNDGFPVFDTPIGKIGLLICMDAMYFEPARILGLQEADIVAFPTNWVGGGTNPPSKTWRLRAKENGVCWIAANRSDTELGAQFTGGSAVIDPNGEVQRCLVDGEGIVYGEIRTDQREASRLYRVRQPQAYQEILLHPYLWREGETFAAADKGTDPFEVTVLPIEPSAAEQLEGALAELGTAAAGAPRLVVLPEGRFRQADTGAPEAAACRGAIAEAARRHGVYIAFGMAAERGEVAAYLYGPEGAVGEYRQVHHRESPDVRSSGRFRVFQLPYGRVGLLTGADAELPESYRVLAKYGADVIAVSGSGTESFEPWMQRIWAFENDAILACARPRHSANSLLFLHRQLDLEGGEPLSGTFRPEHTATARSRPFLRRMKTHLYDPIIQYAKQEVQA